MNECAKKSALSKPITINYQGQYSLKWVGLKFNVHIQKVPQFQTAFLRLQGHVMNEISRSQTYLYSIFYQKATEFLQQPVTTEGIQL